MGVDEQSVFICGRFCLGVWKQKHRPVGAVCHSLTGPRVTWLWKQRVDSEGCQPWASVLAGAARFLWQHGVQGRALYSCLVSKGWKPRSEDRKGGTQDPEDISSVLPRQTPSLSLFLVGPPPLQPAVCDTSPRADSFLRPASLPGTTVPFPILGGLTSGTPVI